MQEIAANMPLGQKANPYIVSGGQFTETQHLQAHTYTLLTCLKIKTIKTYSGKIPFPKDFFRRGNREPGRPKT